MFQFAQEFDFTDGGHVKAVLELTDFDFLYSHLFASGYLSAYESRP